MEEAKISVLMSVYNEPLTFVQAAVDSILLQSYKNLEFIIVVDNPKNESLVAFLKKVAATDSRIILLVNEKNIGLAMSLNRALSKATGTFAARMDADDISKSERLERQIAYIQSADLDVIGCGADKIDENGLAWGEIKAFSRDSSDYAKLLPVQNVLIHPTVMAKMEVLRNVGGYRNFNSCQDYDLWLRLLTEGYRFGVLNENLFQFRRHPNSITATRRFGQILNEKYIRQLYRERLNNKGTDSFSEGNLHRFQMKNGYFDSDVSNRQNSKLQQYALGVKNIKRHRFIAGVPGVVLALSSSAVRETVKTSIRSKILRRRCTGRL